MENIIEFLKQNKLIVILMIGTIILSLVVLVFVLNDNEVNKEYDYILQLFGKEEITILEGDKYIDPGYVAYYQNKLVTNEVIVSGKVDTSKAGVYIITYTIKDKTLTRKVTVLENELNIKFELVGEDITINKGDKYEELGFIAIDQENGDYTNYVSVTNQVNEEEIGTYYVIYKLEYKDYQKELKRKVEVIDPLKLEISYDKSTYKQEIEIKVKVTGSNFNYLKLPNKVIKKEKEITYKVKENGNYMFYAYDTDGNFKQEIVKVQNIDKSIDSATCTLNVKVKSSNIVIDANDLKSGIKYYQYNGSTYTNNSINLNYKLDNASVVVHDNAGNTKVVNCRKNIVESVYGFILIGDSRFVGMKNHLGNNKRSNDTFVARGGMGWNWFFRYCNF